MNSKIFFDAWADADILPLGEASHGTAEFYQARAAITRSLVENHGFNTSPKGPTAGGETQTTTGQRVFWCAMEGLVAGCLLLAGGLTALQSATVASALPFTVVVLALVLSLYLGMREDLAQREAHSGQKQLPAAQPASGQTWQRRLGLMLTAATEKDIRQLWKLRCARLWIRLLRNSHPAVANRKCSGRLMEQSL